jgi:hypothetical protein
MPHAVLLTNQFHQLAGSEIVLAEIAEWLFGEGWTVEFYAVLLDESMCPDRVDGFRVAEFQPGTVDFSEADLVICLHQMVGMISEDLLDAGLASDSWPALLCMHLSAFHPLEAPGPFAEQRLADLILTNSPETTVAMREFGLEDDRLRVFPNPAPESFGAATPAPSRKLKRLLLVSNHPPEEVTEAISTLAESGVEVSFLGFEGQQRRLTPELLAEHDAVLTIGKTVQYALRAGRAVMCYDCFGGCGWLHDAQIMDKAEWYNFSGRDSRQRRSADALCKEILDGYEAARDFALKMQADFPERFRLEAGIRKILRELSDMKNSPDRTLRFRKASKDVEFRKQIHLERTLTSMYRDQARISFADTRNKTARKLRKQARVNRWTFREPPTYPIKMSWNLQRRTETVDVARSAAP